MKGPPPQGRISEQQVVDLTNEAVWQIRNEHFEELWIPTDMIHDSESDDQLAWLLLRYLHVRMGSTLRVLVQLPTPQLDYPELESLDVSFKSLECETFRDPSSRNAKAIKDEFDEYT